LQAKHCQRIGYNYESEPALVALRNNLRTIVSFGVSPGSNRRGFTTNSQTSVSRSDPREAWIENQIAAKCRFGWGIQNYFEPAQAESCNQYEFAPTHFLAAPEAQPPSSCKRSNARSWMSPCVWAGGGFGDSLPQFPKTSEQNRMVGISVFSRPADAGRIFRRPRTTAANVLHDFCNRIWASRASSDRCPSRTVADPCRSNALKFRPALRQRSGESPLPPWSRELAQAHRFVVNE